MSDAIEAVYENGMFKPINPVDWPEGTRVRVETTPISGDTDELIRRTLLADGVKPAEVERILENLRLLWSSYEGLTDAQKEILEQARLDQQNFFTRQHQP